MIEDPQNVSPYADISWEKIDKVRFHTYGAGLFTLLSTFLYPISVLKTRAQVGAKDTSRTTSVKVFKDILWKDGVTGLYRGFATSVTGSIPGRAMFLATLEMSKESSSRLISDINVPEATKKAVSNAVAGLVSSLVSELYYVPLDVVTQRLMVQGLPGVTKYSGGVHAFRAILHTDGVRGLYRGFGMSVITYCPSSAVWWGVYGASQHAIWKSLGYGDGQCPREVLAASVQAAGGTIAGAAASVVTTPLDTIKTRLQVMESKQGDKPTIVGTVKQLINDDGWRGLYRGLGPRFLSMSLWGTSMIVAYEYLKRLSVKPSLQ